MEKTKTISELMRRQFALLEQERKRSEGYKLPSRSEMRRAYEQSTLDEALAEVEADAARR